MMGMIAGFVPTNVLAGGNCLDVMTVEARGPRRMWSRPSPTTTEKQVQKAIMEAMRFKPIWIGPVRYTARDAVIAEGTRRERVIKTGTIVMPATLSAMFDPEAVQRPERVSTRRVPTATIWSSATVYICASASEVAQVQIGESLRALFQRQELRRAKGAGRQDDAHRRLSRKA